MIKEWLIVVLMQMASPTDMPDLYIFETPTFETSEKCIEWVNEYPLVWMPEVFKGYPNREIENVFCVNEKIIKDMVPGYKKQDDNRKERPINTQPIDGQLLV